MSLAAAPTIVRRLECGLTLLVRPNPDAPVATADVWVRTGAADESPEVGGASHFLEHMLFKGTERFGLGEIEREIENLGGVCNAATSYDYTHYFVTAPADAVGRSIDMLGEMTRCSTLDAAEVEKERLVILEEWRRKKDSPAASLYEELYAELWDEGPYRLPVLGTDETIRAISRDDLDAYYRARYAPENMALAASGPIDPDAIAERAERAFAGFDRVARTVAENPAPVAAPAKRRHRERATGGENYVVVAFVCPGADDPDAIVPLDLAQFVLGQGRASILNRELKERRRLASTVSCHYAAKRRTGAFMTVATCRPDKREELIDAIRERFDRFASEPIPDEEFERAKRLLRSAHLFSLETTGGATTDAGHGYALTGDLALTDEYLDRLEAADPERSRALFAEAWSRGAAALSVGPSAP